MVWGSMLWQGSSVLCQLSIMLIRHWEWKFMEFFYLQVLILFSLYLIIEILQVLQKKWKGILWLTLLKILCKIWYPMLIPCYRKYCLLEFRNSMYIWWYCAHSSYCVLWSYYCQNQAHDTVSSVFQVLFEPCQSQILPSTLMFR